SRATVREALRLLAAQSLIRTAKGATGGSYVTVPSADHLSESLRSGIGLLADTKDVSLEELLEARELLEVPAARLAAARRREQGDARAPAVSQALLREGLAARAYAGLMGLRFGVQGSGQLVGGVPPPAHFRDVAVLAEGLGYDSLWAGDHISFTNPILDVTV